MNSGSDNPSKPKLPTPPPTSPPRRAADQLSCSNGRHRFGPQLSNCPDTPRPTSQDCCLVFARTRIYHWDAPYFRRCTSNCTSPTLYSEGYRLHTAQGHSGAAGGHQHNLPRGLRGSRRATLGRQALLFGPSWPCSRDWYAHARNAPWRATLQGHDSHRTESLATTHMSECVKSRLKASYNMTSEYSSHSTTLVGNPVNPHNGAALFGKTKGVPNPVPANIKSPNWVLSKKITNSLSNARGEERYCRWCPAPSATTPANQGDVLRKFAQWHWHCGSFRLLGATRPAPMTGPRAHGPWNHRTCLAFSTPFTALPTVTGQYRQACSTNVPKQ